MATAEDVSLSGVDAALTAPVVRPVRVAAAAPAATGGAGGAPARDPFEAATGSPSPAAPPASADAEEGIHAHHPFFHYYGLLVHQQNMLQDAARTGTYHKAMIANVTDFRGKVVMDVGTGSGILAFFAVKAGAKRVYAVEASDVAEHARRLVEANGLAEKIIVVRGKVEEVFIPEPVDVIVSEPMGFLLVHERMLESYMIARQRFLKPGGLMYPTTGTIFVAPFSDAALWQEQNSRADFWKTRDFFGLDLSCLVDQASKDHFSQPIVGYFDPSVLLCGATAQYTIDFAHDRPESLREFIIPFAFTIARTGIMHGVACWFDVLFAGTSHRVTLSTSPYAEGTHWYQCRLLLPEPLAVNATQGVTGRLEFQAHEKYSYNVTLHVHLDGTHIVRTARINLQDQYYHYMAATPTAVASATPTTATTTTATAAVHDHTADAAAVAVAAGLAPAVDDSKGAGAAGGGGGGGGHA